MIMRIPTDSDVTEVFANLREEDLDVVERFVGLKEGEAAAREMMKHFPSQVFVAESGEVAALWIALRRWEGVAELLAYTTNAVEGEKVGFIRACRRGMQHMVDIMGIHKFECSVWGEYTRSLQWLKMMGFEIEGIRKQHGPDRTDAYMLGKVVS